MTRLPGADAAACMMMISGPRFCFHAEAVNLGRADFLTLKNLPASEARGFPPLKPLPSPARSRQRLGVVGAAPLGNPAFLSILDADFHGVETRRIQYARERCLCGKLCCFMAMLICSCARGKKKTGLSAGCPSGIPGVNGWEGIKLHARYIIYR